MAKCYICGREVTLHGKYLQVHGPKNKRCNGSYWLYDDMLDVEQAKVAQHHMHTDAASAAVTQADAAPESNPVKPAGSQAAPVM